LKILQSKYPNQKTRVLLLQSELYSQQKQFPKAFGILSEALKGSPDDKDILYTHALMAERVGKLDVLEANLRKILQHNPNSVEALNALGYTLVDKTTRYEEAERYLKRALELAPNEAVILDSYGWLQYKRGKLPEALDYLRRAYDKQREAEIAAHLAEVLWLSGKQDEAKAVFKEAFEKTPDDDYLLDFKKRLLDKAN
jgi:Tfp pilus assembly protein PilF